MSKTIHDITNVYAFILNGMSA